MGLENTVRQEERRKRGVRFNKEVRVRTEGGKKRSVITKEAWEGEGIEDEKEGKEMLKSK